MLLVDVDPSVCCLSLGYISKTKQDRSIVTVKHYVEVNTVDAVVALSFLHRARYSGFKCWKICLILIWPPVQLWHQTTCVVNMVKPSSHRRCCQQCVTIGTCYEHSLSVVLIKPVVWRKNGTRGGPASYHSGDILVTYCLLKTVAHLD